MGGGGSEIGGKVGSFEVWERKKRKEFGEWERVVKDVRPVWGSLSIYIWGAISYDSKSLVLMLVELFHTSLHFLDYFAGIIRL